MLSFGIDIGGTMIKTAIVNEKGELDRKKLYPTGKGLEEQLLGIIDLELYENRVEAIGIGTAGRVNPRTGSVSLATDNLADWTGVRIKEIIEEKTGITTSVINDANAAAFGEWFVNHRNAESLAMLTVGTGLGGGVVIDGLPLLGKRGEAAEFGHQILYPGGRKCNCGKNGCAEQYVSMRLIHRLVAEVTGYEIERTELIKQFLGGDPIVHKAVQRVAKDLAVLIDSVFLNFDPDIVVVGGGISELGDSFLDLLREEISHYERASLYTGYNVVLSGSGNDSGIVGAAIYAMNRVLKDYPTW